MSDADIRLARQQVEVAEESLRRAKESLKRATLVVPEPAPGSVITFSVRFTEDGIKYTYAAIRIAGSGWYVTGAGTSRTWDQVVAQMGKDYRVRSGAKPIRYRKALGSSVGWMIVTAGHRPSDSI